jgi:DNA-binding winged helix-turn-helix (wHTH) protein
MVDCGEIRQLHFLIAAWTPCGRSLSINTQSFETFMDGLLVPLTRMQFDLLLYLVRHSDRVVSQQELIERVLGATYRADSSVIRVHIAHVRRKLGERDTIETVRGRGFRFRATEDATLRSKPFRSVHREWPTPTPTESPRTTTTAR